MKTKSSKLAKIGLCSLVAAAGLLINTKASAQTFFSDNFNSYADDSRLGSPWTWAVETFTSGGSYNGGYYPGDTASAGINAILNTVPGDNSSNVLKFYGDYGFAPNFDNNQFVHTSVYLNRTLSAGDVVAGTVRLNFDYYGWNPAEGGLAGVSTARGWVKLLSANFADIYYVDNFNIPASPGGSGSAQIVFDGTQEGLQLQYGFTVVSQNYSPTAIALDNIVVARVAPIPEPASFSLIGACFAGAFVMLRRRRNQS